MIRDVAPGEAVRGVNVSRMTDGSGEDWVQEGKEQEKEAGAVHV